VQKRRSTESIGEGAGAMLAARAADYGGSAAGHSEADEEDNHQHRRGSGGGSREKLNKNVVQTHD
jgi:hypothetical protein